MSQTQSDTICFYQNTSGELKLSCPLNQFSELKCAVFHSASKLVFHQDMIDEYTQWAQQGMKVVFLEFRNESMNETCSNEWPSNQFDVTSNIHYIAVADKVRYSSRFPDENPSTMMGFKWLLDLLRQPYLHHMSSILLTLFLQAQIEHDKATYVQWFSKVAALSVPPLFVHKVLPLLANPYFGQSVDVVLKHNDIICTEDMKRLYDPYTVFEDARLSANRIQLVTKILQHPASYNFDPYAIDMEVTRLAIKHKLPINNLERALDICGEDENHMITVYGHWHSCLSDETDPKSLLAIQSFLELALVEPINRALCLLEDTLTRDKVELWVSSLERYPLQWCELFLIYATSEEIDVLQHLTRLWKTDYIAGMLEAICASETRNHQRLWRRYIENNYQAVQLNLTTRMVENTARQITHAAKKRRIE